MKAYDKQFIGGLWREGRGEGLLDNINPFSGEVLYSYRPASREDVDEAYAAAKAAQKLWADYSPSAKAAVLERLLSIIREYRPIMDECLLLEAGCAKPKRDYEAGTSPDFVSYCMTFPKMMEGRIQSSDFPGQTNFVFRKPKGVVTVIAPWNVPFILALRSVIPAVAAGNAVVLKPSTETPASAFIIGEMFEKAGFPKGLLNVIAGRGSDIGDYIVAHPLSDIVSFTGSTQVGRRIGRIAGENIRDMSLELGGNNSMLVLPDADIDAAVEAAIFGAYFHQGQICMSLNRIFVVGEENYSLFCEKMAAAVRSLKAGDPADENVFIGPIINTQQVEHINSLISATVETGARVLVEGKTEGNLVYPWLLCDVENSMPAAREEVFGPVCSIIKAESEEEAIAMANDTIYGLSNSIFTRDRYRGMLLAQKLESGMVHINDQSIGDEPHVMFGAEKQSGVGRFNGTWVLNKFTTEQWIPVR
ncbi:MAG: aldehyde dehydrogenase family protein [Ruminococcaceae bacterium]|nr:aldehyde dehydrogenase family protein [Oscillospiraceae bacterium]